MAIFKVGGTERHFKNELLGKIVEHFEKDGVALPEPWKPALVNYALRTVAEMVSPGGLFADRETECLLGDLMHLSPDERASLGTSMVKHLKDQGLPRAVLLVAHCPHLKKEVLLGTHGRAMVPLCFLGPINLRSISAAALEELGKPAGSRRIQFHGSDTAKTIQDFTRIYEVHRRHVAESAHSSAQRTRHAAVPASA